MDICIDFDGTCVTHRFPEIGNDIGAVPVLKKLVAAGHNLILFTMRSDIETVTSKEEDICKEPGDYLTQAINWFKDNNIPLYGINSNPTQTKWTASPKAYGHLYIDDAALGIPLKRTAGERNYVDWETVENVLIKMQILTTTVYKGDLITKYRDGGTEVVELEDGRIVYRDFRIGSMTQNKFFSEYPDSVNAEQLDIVVDYE